MRIGRPMFLRDTVLAALAGAAGGLVLALVVAAAGYPEWGEVLHQALSGLGIFYVVALVMRLALHGMYDYANSGTDLTTAAPREQWLRYTRPLLWLGAGGFAAGAIISLAFGLFGPDAG